MKLLRISREDRLAARWKIIQAANKYKMRARVPIFGPDRSVTWYEPRLWGMKDLNRAVNLCRRQSLVKPDVLITAGFNPTKRKGRGSSRKVVIPVRT